MKHFSLRARLTAAFLLIYLVPVLALGIPGSLWIAHSARDAASRLLETRLENASERMEAMFSSMDSYANQMQGDALVRGLMYMQDRSQLFTRYSAAEYANFAYQLKLALVTTDMFDDVALCFPGKNFCLTQRGSYDLDMLIENEFAVAGMDEAGWQALWGPDYSPASLLPDITMETFGQQRAGMLYLRVAPPPYGETPLFAMIYFISDAGVRRCLQPLADYGTLTLTLALPQGDTPLVQGRPRAGRASASRLPSGGSADRSPLASTPASFTRRPIRCAACSSPCSRSWPAWAPAWRCWSRPSITARSPASSPPSFARARWTRRIPPPAT